MLHARPLSSGSCVRAQCGTYCDALIGVASVSRCDSIVVGACGMWLRSYRFHFFGFGVIYRLSHRRAFWSRSGMAQRCHWSRYDGACAVPPCNRASRPLFQCYDPELFREVPEYWSRFRLTLTVSSIISAMHHSSSFVLLVFLCSFSMSSLSRNHLIVNWLCVPLVSIRYSRHVGTRPGWIGSSVTGKRDQWGAWGK